MPLPILQPPPNTPLLPDPDRDSIWKRWFFQLWRLVKDGALGGTVTSVNVSGGTTGLTTSGGPITTSGTITIAGTLDTANGGTGLTAAGTAGNVLTSDGTDWTSAAPSGGADELLIVYNNENLEIDTNVQVTGHRNLVFEGTGELIIDGTGSLEIVGSGTGSQSPADNVCINGGFTINQMEYVSGAALSSGTYGHDQWKAGASGGDYTFTQLPSNTTITIAASKSLIQIIETVNVVGGTYTLSWTGTAQGRFGVDSATPSGAYAASPITISGQTAGTVMSIEFNTGTLGTVQLETGALVNAFVQRSYQEELNLCLRYFEVISAASGGASGYGVAQAASTSRAVLGLTWKAFKRTAPTVTLSAASDWAFYNTGISGYVVWSSFTPSTTLWGGVLDVTTTTAGLGGAGTATMSTPNAATTAARIYINSRL